jgi:hypothetical protein
MTNYLLGAAAMVAVVLSLSALAEATSGRGSVAEVREQGRTIILTVTDGKTRMVHVSDARTKIMIAGQTTRPEAIRPGMSCTVTGADGADASKIECS